MYSINPNLTEILTIDPALILTVEEVGAWLNLPTGLITKNTALLESLIKTATTVVENYTWLALRRKSFRADYELNSNIFYSFFAGGAKLNLQRSPILTTADIGIIEYLDSTGNYVTFDKGVMTVDGLYENVTEKKEARQWASVYFRESVPFDDRVNAYKIRITFEAGFTTDIDEVTDLPDALKTAMLMIIASYYTNRGDCDDRACTLSGYAVPCSAKSIIDQYTLARTILS